MQGADVWRQPQMYMVGSQPICVQAKGLTPGQQKLCHLYHDHMPAVSRGAAMGIQECQWQFRGRRWNCSTLEGDASVFGPVLDIGKRL
jgi:hypothetical protein